MEEKKISKKLKILKLQGMYKPSVIAKKVGCRREYVYIVFKNCGIKLDSPDYLGASLSILKKYLSGKNDDKVKKALKLITLSRNARRQKNSRISHRMGHIH